MNRTDLCFLAIVFSFESDHLSKFHLRFHISYQNEDKFLSIEKLRREKMTQELICVF